MVRVQPTTYREGSQRPCDKGKVRESNQLALTMIQMSNYLITNPTLTMSLTEYDSRPRDVPPIKVTLRSVHVYSAKVTKYQGTSNFPKTIIEYVLPGTPR